MQEQNTASFSVILKLYHYEIKGRIPNENIHVYRKGNITLEATAAPQAYDFYMLRREILAFGISFFFSKFLSSDFLTKRAVVCIENIMVLIQKEN